MSKQEEMGVKKNSKRTWGRNLKRNQTQKTQIFFLIKADSKIIHVRLSTDDKVRLGHKLFWLT